MQGSVNLSFGDDGERLATRPQSLTGISDNVEHDKQSHSLGATED